MSKEYYDTKWIGSYPDDWKIVGLTKYIESKVDYRGKTPNKTDDGIFLVTAKNIKNGIIDYEISKEYISKNDYSKVMSRGLPLIGDVLFTTEAPLGEVASVDKLDIALAQRVIKLRANSNYLSNYYLKYWMLSEGFYQNLQSFATGSTALGIKSSKLFNLRLLLPPNLNIQKIIVNFLNKKLSEIDNLIFSKEKQIQLLEEQLQAMITEAVTKGIDSNVGMKDSKIEWIDKIPKHWRVYRLKNVVIVNTSNIDKKVKKNENTIKLCNYTDVYYNKTITSEIDFMEATANEKQIAKFLLKKGQVIITKDSESPDDIGIPAYVAEDFTDVVCGYHLTVLKPNKKFVLGKYLFYMLLSEIFQEQLHSRANGVTRYGLNLSAIENIIVLLPTLKEQIKITDRLDNLMIEINEVIEKSNNQILKLKEYRQSLIHEAVTGKIPVDEMEKYLKEVEEDGN